MREALGLVERRAILRGRAARRESAARSAAGERAPQVRSARGTASSARIAWRLGREGREPLLGERLRDRGLRRRDDQRLAGLRREGRRSRAQSAARRSPAPRPERR